MEREWNMLEKILFLCSLLWALGAAGGLESGALSFGSWLAHTGAGILAARRIYRKGVRFYVGMVDKGVSIPLLRMSRPAMRESMRKGSRMA